MTIELEDCPGCLAAPSESHGEDCDHARCPDCGEQLLFHDCEHWDEDADGPTRPALWHGVDQRAEVARILGWWTTAAGMDRLVEDYTRVLFADALGQTAWNPRTQRYDIGAVDEAALDRAIADSR
jgi:hypothetical protein